mgnify:CR=1 FL=1
MATSEDNGGHPVAALARNAASVEGWPVGVQVVRGDLADREAVAWVVSESDA